MKGLFCKSKYIWFSTGKSGAMAELLILVLTRV